MEATVSQIEGREIAANGRQQNGETNWDFGSIINEIRITDHLSVMDLIKQRIFLCRKGHQNGRSNKLIK